ncbi:MAG: DNA alkylation repair protein [Muribaculum sp.]|nr:DNA alkylation repair protein [Muribaculum sp.]
MTTEAIREELFALQDTAYGDFHAALIPTVSRELIIGVRTPELRKLSKRLWKTGETDAFMAQLPHKYYEENNLHAFFIEQIRDYESCVEALDAFLPYVDNWATCDMMSPKVLGRNRERLAAQIKIWLASKDVYVVRFAIGMLMKHFLEEDFDEEALKRVADIRSGEYYINMMRAWYFATALAKQYAAALPLIEAGRMDVWTHNKAIQKAVESNRIAPEQKIWLKSLKRKA